MNIKNKLAWIAALAAIFSMLVIVVGAYTRITDAGLSCPDWPGCYGKIVVPSGDEATAAAQQAFPDTPLEHRKAWTEMIHRYLGGTVGLLILALLALSWKHRRILGAGAFRLSLLMLVVIACQVMLGKWTVTMRLMPGVVTSHLTFGLTLMSLLWLYALRLWLSSGCTKDPVNLGIKVWAWVAFVLVAMQAVSGGWTSTNMAGHVCHGYPVCAGYSLASLNLTEAFSLSTPFGQMPLEALKGITSIHRIGSLLVFTMLGSLSFILLTMAVQACVRKVAAISLLVLIVQLGIGFMNIPASRPDWVATAHNGAAALLLLCSLTLAFVLSKSAGEHDD